MQKQIKPQTLGRFLIKVESVAAAVAALPIGAKIMHLDSQYLNPPLGTLDSFVVPMAALVVGLFGALPWLFGNRRWACVGALLSAALCVASLISYAVFVSRYIVRVDAPGGKVLQASVGTERTEWAREQKDLKDDSDASALMKAGWSEVEIREIWTVHSILVSRLRLLVSFIGVFAAFIFSVGSLTRFGGLRR
jgi:hypothetical protein